METSAKLIDKFGRHINYIRISVTDRCDFRCVYCMEEKMQFLPRARLLTLEELSFIAQAFSELGVAKIRITGGEPLIRRNVLQLLQNINELPDVQELVLTTNGSKLTKMATALHTSGVRRVNISLDSLRSERFHKMTRTGNLATVIAGIEAACAAGFERLKINSVILKNRNHDEVIDLVDFALKHDMDISFIEEMPLGMNNDHERAEVFYSSDDIRSDIQRHYDMIPTTETTGGPSQYFRLQHIKVGFISPHSHNFCDLCNRVRLTCEGRLLLCLGQEHSVDLRAVVRTFPGDMKKLKKSIQEAMLIKPKGHDFRIGGEVKILRHMNVTGG